MNRFVAAATMVAGLVLSNAIGSHAQSAEAGQAIFKRECGTWHSPLAGKNVIGPSLFGIVGRTAGSDPSFHYTEANKNSGLPWDPATLDRYLTAARTVIPGTTMT